MNNREFGLSEAEQAAIQQREAATSDVRELKRLQAVRLYGSGQTMNAVVNVVGSSSRTIQRWVADYQERGIAGLKPRWQGANAKKLSDGQRAEMVQRIQQYQPDQVLSGEIRLSQGQYWTVSDLRLAIQAWYGVTYQKADTYQTLLHQCGFSYQRAARVYRSW